MSEPQNFIDNMETIARALGVLESVTPADKNNPMSIKIAIDDGVYSVIDYENARTHSILLYRLLKKAEEKYVITRRTENQRGHLCVVVQLGLQLDQEDFSSAFVGSRLSSLSQEEDMLNALLMVAGHIMGHIKVEKEQPPAKWWKGLEPGDQFCLCSDDSYHFTVITNREGGLDVIDYNYDQSREPLHEDPAWNDDFEQGCFRPIRLGGKTF